MQLTHILTAAFATLATAQRYHPHGYQLQQRDAVNNGSDSSSSSSSGTTTSNPAVQSSSSSINAVASTASFTQYGPCNDPTKTSCAWYSSTGYNAAISQAVYNGSPGSGPSGACGVCWKLSPDFPGANEIVVKVNNLCPDDGRNPLCSQAAGELDFPLFFHFLLLDSVYVGVSGMQLGLVADCLCWAVYRCRCQFRPLPGQWGCGGPVRQFEHGAG